MQLDRELDLPIFPIELTSAPRFDDTMTIIGYGQTDSPDAEGRQRRTGVPVLDIGVPIWARISQHSLRDLGLTVGMRAWCLVKAVSFDTDAGGH